MKNTTLFSCFFFLLLSASSLFAQETKSNVILSFGLGDNVFLNSMGDFDYTKFYKIEVTKKYPTALFKCEYKTDKKSGYVIYANYSYQGYTSYSTPGVAAEVWQPSYATAATLQTLQIGFRYNSYFIDKAKFQLYFGGGFGIKYHWLVCSPYEKTTYSPLRAIGVEMTVGARYYVTPHVAFYSEVGIANSLSQAGISLRF